MTKSTGQPRAPIGKQAKKPVPPKNRLVKEGASLLKWREQREMAARL